MIDNLIREWSNMKFTIINISQSLLKDPLTKLLSRYSDTSLLVAKLLLLIL